MNHNYMIKCFGLAGLLSLPFVMADAASLTPEAALQRALGVSTGQLATRSADYELGHTEKAGGENILYVFNRGNEGFVVVSADDCFNPILGYSDNGAFDYDSAPPQLKWWLNEYAMQGDYALKNMVLTPWSADAKSTRAARENIAPLVQTKWNQDYPYNLDCPEDAGGKCITGCVATAMAQIIKYHGYPTQGKGKHSYDWNGTTLSFDYGATTFDYANMLDTYVEYDEYGRPVDNATEEQKKAVAQLMYACGVGVNMRYSSGESAAGDYGIPFAFVNLFNYDSGTKYVKRTYYTTEEWEDLIYTELSEKRPVLYGGQAPGGGGHEFVCDGYENGYFHINWGWSGLADGFYSLSNLLPEHQGLGGFDGGYNNDQGVVMGIKPSAATGGATPNISMTGSLNVMRLQSNVVIDLSIDGGMICNYGPEDANVLLAFKMVSSSGKEYIGDPADYEFKGALESVIGYSAFGLYLPKGVPAGDYTGHVVYKNSAGEWEEVYAPIAMISYLKVDVDKSGNMTVTQGEPRQKADIKVTAFGPAEVVRYGVPAEFDMTIENLSDIEYSGYLYIRTYKHGTNEEISEASQTFNGLTVGPQTSFSIYFYLTYNLADGLYDVIIYDYYGREVSETLPLWIGVPPVYVSEVTLNQSEVRMAAGSTYQLEATVHPDNADNPTVVWSTSNPEIANVDEDGLVTAFAAGEVTITVRSVESEDKYASCVITVYVPVESVTFDRSAIEAEEGTVVELQATVLPEDATDKTLQWRSSNEEVASVNENGVVTVHTVGEAVISATTTDGTELTAECVITGISGIADIIADDALFDIYTVAGVIVKKDADKSSLSTLKKGVYILVSGSKKAKVVI